MFGKRKDAKRVSNLSGLTQICIDLKPRRCDSDVYINQKIDVTKLVEYMENKKKENDDITYFHVFITAFGKVFYNRPKMNMFVANRHIYEHNDVTISFVAKTSFNDKSEEIMIMVPIKKEDAIDTLSKKISNSVNSVRDNSSKKEGANDAIDTLGKLPNVIRVPVVGMFKLFDKHGMLPKSLIHNNIYYSSLIMSNLGSIKCDAIYHNITNFGTCSGIVTIGEIKEEEVIVNGKKEIKKMCEFGINFDERIADGYYMIKSIKLLQYIFNNPILLEEKMNKKIDMDEIRK